MAGNPGTTGHRVVAHTADMQVQAWAPSVGECLAEAAKGLVHSFADIPAVTDVSEAPDDADDAAVRQLDIPAAAPADQLVTLLDEVIYRMDAHGELPRDVTAEPSAGGGLHVRFQMVDTTTVDTVGAVPKAVSLHELSCTEDDDGWVCSVTIDV
ncbi:archease [Phytoactinopolyspora halotolerans]|uniref:Archease n=1 Tax=Phytoactinopolyspora halotolerans TaxID=1981512 RepID=A0A6L9SDR9_9ACTN|nr:archease [Phytoactinopolyspora halotolerans]NEE03169.1 archease [Phytoactinopolyspora halotolerans]